MYVAVLGVLQAGAAYLCRWAGLSAGSGRLTSSVIAARALRHHHTSITGADARSVAARPVVVFEDEEAEMAARRVETLTRADTGLTADDCAYIIYTSGSTSHPIKVVMISHRSICHLVRSEGSVLDLREDDIVFQGFSLSFDMSLEEIWPAWAAGATLLVGTTEMMRAGGDLAENCSRRESVNCLVVRSTLLLAMQEATEPTLRLLNLGGEACPPELVRLHARPGLRILNTYGPTEATITATVAEIFPDKPVTIGRPLPNYTCRILQRKNSLK